MRPTCDLSLMKVFSYNIHPTNKLLKSLSPMIYMGHAIYPAIGTNVCRTECLVRVNSNSSTIETDISCDNSSQSNCKLT